MEQNLSSSDHDLLIQISVTQTAMREEMRQTNTQSTTQLADHEARIRVLERNDDTKSGSRQGTSGSIKWILAILGTVAGVAEPLLMLYIGLHK